MKEIYVIEANDEIVLTFESKEKAVARFRLIRKQHPDARLITYVKYLEIEANPKKVEKVLYCESCEKRMVYAKSDVFERIGYSGHEYYCSHECLMRGTRIVPFAEHDRLPWFVEESLEENNE